MKYNLNYDSHFLPNNLEQYYIEEENQINPNFLDLAYEKRMFAGRGQQERMIADKLKTLLRALRSSYQGADIQKEGEDNIIRVLINPNKLKFDYDDKILSAKFESGIQAGDIFEWLGTNTYWIVYLQSIEELAYFRSEIRRCCYHLRWKDEDGIIRETYAAERGPVETKIDYIQKSGISVDNPNHSLHILMPKNKHTLNYFKRYAKFYVPDADKPERDICWRVEAFDSISTPGILEITAVEYYANEFEDDLEQGIAQGKVLTKLEQMELVDNEENIVGPIFIKPRSTTTYKYIGTDYNEWNFDGKLPIEIINKTQNTITIKWNSSYSGQFELEYGDLRKTIVVESLF